MTSIAFGPVPSRRLGKSLGVNNIPDKICTYACVYCQIGRTLKMEIERREFYEPRKILEEVEKKIREAENRDEKIDYITFVPDGEPTLDINLGREIEMLKDLGYPVAILTNASLLWMEDLREELLSLDFISLKLDAVTEELWRRIDRPHKSLKLPEILEGMLELRKNFRGKVVTETMLLDGITYGNELENMGKFLKKLNPDKSYIAVPTRPPWEKWVKPASENLILKAHAIFSEYIGEERVELLVGYEGNAFAFTGNLREDILSITAVHPMRREAVETLLKKAGESWDTVENMIREGELMEIEYGGVKFYMRRLKSRERG
ncbi:MAG: radical SAM protein [Thermoplasmata archaeon]|nr:radical SAM protein [Thermoplasmata archaeon]